MARLRSLRFPAVVRPGEAFLVESLDELDNPLPWSPDYIVDINGQCGERQMLQYRTAGRYALAATVRDTSGKIVGMAAGEVRVEGPSLTFDTEGGRALPMLNITHDLETPYRLTFSVGTPLPERHRDFQPAEPLSTDRRYHWNLGDGSQEILVTREPWVEHDFLWDCDHTRLWSTFDVSCRITPEDVLAARTLSVASAPRMLQDRGFLVPVIRSDVAAEVGEGTFTCAMYVHNVTAELVSLDARSVTAILADGVLDSPGEFQALGERLEIKAHSIGVVIVQLRGGVDVPRRATGVIVQFAGTSQSGLPARLSATYDLPLRPRELPSRMDVPPPGDWPWDRIRDGLAELPGRVGVEFGGFQRDEKTGMVVANVPPQAIGSGRLPELAEAAGRILRAPFEGEVLSDGVPGSALVLVAANNGEAAAGEMVFLDDQMCDPAMPIVGPVLENEICDPDNIGSADQATATTAKLTCALTDKWVCPERPARWMNARKGDIVLSPGHQWSLIADVLAAVKPSQPFSHCGVMSRNYDEITHQTACEEWLMDHKSNSFTSDGSDGLQPEALRYIWPGVVTQSIDASIGGEFWVAPDNGKRYEISSFSPAQVTTTGFGYMPAMVVKPDPFLEATTPGLRQKLHAVADGIKSYAGARAADGTVTRNSKSHYRFYCFTDARLSETEIVPAGHGWADGTFPSVCSNIIWREMRKQSLQMEGANPVTVQSDLEIEDTLRGATVAAGTLDGLYQYTASERQEAGQMLFNKVKAFAYEQAGWLGEALTDASDDTANQVVNAFANDDVNGMDSDAWRSTGASDGVSPYNLLFWDAPDRGGSYGFAEVAAYRPRRVERYRLSRWKKYQANGEVWGKVTRPGGGAVAHAAVQLVDGKFGGTDTAGNYRITGVPYLADGSTEYSLTAAVVVDNELYTTTKDPAAGPADAATVIVKMTGPSIQKDFELHAPPTSHRKVKIVAAVMGGDDEDFVDDESFSQTNAPVELELTKDAPSKVVGTGRDPKFRWGGEVRSEHFIEVILLPGAHVAVTAKGWLYEGTSESTDDLDYEGPTVRTVVGEGTTRTLEVKLWNQDDNEPDTYSNLTLTITNDPF